MKKKKSRAEKAGENMADSIIEMVNLFYQKNTALNFLWSLVHKLKKELDKRYDENNNTT